MDGIDHVGIPCSDILLVHLHGSICVPSSAGSLLVSLYRWSCICCCQDLALLHNPRLSSHDTLCHLFFLHIFYCVSMSCWIERHYFRDIIALLFSDRILLLVRVFRIYRAAVNHKITAPVCFIGLSAPSITMYAMTIMGQPSPERISEMIDTPDLRTRWNDIHRRMYLPVMHFMMFLSLVGFASSLRKF
jgi:hypothetical protein